MECKRDNFIGALGGARETNTKYISQYPGKRFGLKFIPRQSDSFRFIPKSVSAPIREKFLISFDVIWLKIDASLSESIRDF